MARLAGWASLLGWAGWAATLWGALEGVIVVARAGLSSASELACVPIAAGLYAPLLLGLGAAAGMLTSWVANVPSWRAAVAALGRRSFWLEPRADGVARRVAEFVLLGALAGVLGGLVLVLTPRFARTESVAGVVAVVGAGFVVLWPGLRRPLTWVVRRLVPTHGVLARPIVWAVVVIAAVVVAWSQVRYSEHVFVVRWLDTLWVPLGLVGSLVLVAGLRHRGTAFGRSGVVVAAVLFAVAALGGRAWPGARATLVRGGILAPRLEPYYADAADRDGDGHASAFGGDDCDDSRAAVHPGALDRPGDGVDADCFGGDGTPDVAPLGDGALARSGVRQNVLLLTIDTLSREHLGVNGYARATSPNIDRFASQAVQFRRVVPQSSRSVLSIPSMLLGLYPSQIARGPQGFWPEVLAENESVVETLARAGVRTEAYIGTNYFAPMPGLYQGFAHVEQASERRGPRRQVVEQTIRALERLAVGSSPWLVWSHLMNVHEPYLDDGAPSRFGPEVVDRYDTEIQIADAEVGEILAALDRLGIADRTAVILASDHGEAFGRHGGVYFHASTLYEDQLASMLFARIPGVTPGGVVRDAPVGLLDVAPTLLDVMGVDPARPMAAESLIRCARGDCNDSRLLFAELIPEGAFTNHVRKVVTGAGSVLWDVRHNTLEGYLYADDPHELRNRLNERTVPDPLPALVHALRAWVAGARLEHRGDDAFIDQFRVERIPTSAMPIHTTLDGQLEVEACEVPSRARPAETIEVRCTLRSLGRMQDDWRLVVWFEGTAPAPTDFHGIHEPLQGRYPTSRWRPGERLLDVAAIAVPPSITAPSRWDVHFAIDALDGTRQWLTRDGQRVLTVRLGTLEILP